MNRRSAITRARNLIRQQVMRKSRTPVISIHENGNFQVKIGSGGLLIRLSRSESEPVADTV